MYIYKALLTLVGTIKVRPDMKLVAYDFFKVNTKNGAPVKIAYIGNDFKAWFLCRTKERSVTDKTDVEVGIYRTPGRNLEVVLNYHILSDTMDHPRNDESIIEQLGGETKAETTLAEVAACLQKQPNGESGVLFSDIHTNNMFYVRDIKGVLRAVSVGWGGYGWILHASLILPQGWWGSGRRVFSRYISLSS